MPNPYVNKVQKSDGTTIIDITDTTAEASDVAEGAYFYLASGQRTVGTASMGLFLASYGSSTYNEVLAAYQANKIVYCRASSNSNPATGNQLRMAFLAYVNNQTTPTEFEFQYYRSVNGHSDAQQGDQVYVYKLSQSSGWSVTVREAYTKIVAGTGLSSSYSSGTLTLTNTVTGLPTVTSSDNGKVLMVSSGAWTAVAESKDVFIVTVTETYNDQTDSYVYSADKTFSEIYSHIQNGEYSLARMFSGYGWYYYSLFTTEEADETEGTQGSITYIQTATVSNSVQSDWIMIYDDESVTFESLGFGASSTAPLVDGTATVGTSTTYARADHVHPKITQALSMSSNVITLTGSDGTTSSVTLPVYNGGVQTV